MYLHFYIPILIYKNFNKDIHYNYPFLLFLNINFENVQIFTYQFIVEKFNL